MDKNGFVRRVACGAGVLCLWAGTRSMFGQSNTQSSVPSPRPSQPTARSKGAPSAEDDFAGLTLTDEQKAKIDQIHQKAKARMDVVRKDEKLNDDQKNAMLDGYKRIERGETFEVLTPEQQKQVREKIRARHSANKPQMKPSPMKSDKAR